MTNAYVVPVCLAPNAVVLKAWSRQCRTDQHHRLEKSLLQQAWVLARQGAQALQFPQCAAVV